MLFFVMQKCSLVFNTVFVCVCVVAVVALERTFFRDGVIEDSVFLSVYH